MNELLKCYLETSACPLFFAASNKKTPPFTRPVTPDSPPWSMYVGVDWKPQEHGTLTANVLAYLTGEEEPEMRESDCRADSDQNVYDYVFLRGETVPEWWEGDLASCNASFECGHCYRTLSFRRLAVSPAFVIEE